MGRFNLSAWGIRHPQLIAFLILAIGLAGAFAYSQLGRAEDPAFTIKVAIVTADWPGATTTEMQYQVTDRIEKKLQELPISTRSTLIASPASPRSASRFKTRRPPREVPLLFLDCARRWPTFAPIFPPR